MSEITKKEWDSVKDYIHYVIDNPNSTPNDIIVLSTTSSNFCDVLTKKRFELLNLIKDKPHLSLSEISKLLHRGISAVQRDITLLENYGVIEIEKRGRKSIPTLKGSILVFPIESIGHKTLSELKGAIKGELTWSGYPLNKRDTQSISNTTLIHTENEKNRTHINEKINIPSQNHNYYSPEKIIDFGSISCLSPTNLPL